MRVVQPLGRRGSLKWIQKLADEPTGSFERELHAAGALAASARFEWLSPRLDDAWSEYRDGAFLDLLGLHGLRDKLSSFWPRRGPQWDGLGRGSDGVVYLIEAKAHLGELASTCQASPASRTRIELALAASKRSLGAPAEADWLTGFYQYANRLAHLDFMRRMDVPAKLLFLYFTNDVEMNGPKSEAAWRTGTQGMRSQLGLPETGTAHVHDIFLDTRLLN